MKTVASSSFNSLQVSLKHNTKYVNFLVAYTYEKSIDNGSTSFDATNVYNSALSRALSIFDVPQDLTVSYTVQLPFDRLTGGAAKRLTAGWALSGIATFAKGEPVQLSESDDNSLSGTFDGTIDEPKVVRRRPLVYKPESANSADNPTSTQITSLQKTSGRSEMPCAVSSVGRGSTTLTWPC